MGRKGNIKGDKYANTPIVLVTGASMGIGFAISETLGLHGFEVILVSRSLTNLKQAKIKLVEQGIKCHIFKCDVSNSEATKTCLRKIVMDVGIPNVVVNNVGWGGPFLSLDKISAKDWAEIFRVNVESVYSVCHFLLPLMKKNGGSRIINIGSIYGLLGGQGSSAYSAAKHAVIGLTKSIAVEWGKYNIQTNCVLPGFIKTHRTTKIHEKLSGKMAGNEMGAPNDVAELVLFLSSCKTKYINGATITIDGGSTAGYTVD